MATRRQEFGGIDSEFLVRLPALSIFLIPQFFSIPWKRNVVILGGGGYRTFLKDRFDSPLVCWYNYQQKAKNMRITFKEAEIRAKIIKAMAHSVRLIVIEFLKNGERSFSDIFDLFKLDKSTVSKHLLVLKEAGIVSSRKDGADMIYKLEVPCITDFFSCVTAVIASNVKRQQVCLLK